MARYSNSSNSQDLAENILLGRDGSVYVSGFSDSEASSKAVIVKYSAAGQHLWAAENTNITRVNLIGPLPLTALDFNGGVHIAGNRTGTTNEITVAGYTTGGLLIWEEQFVEGFESHPHALAVDASSNTIVVGWSKSSPAADALILKYASGSLLWKRSYSLLPASADYAYSIAVLAQGDILVGVHCDSRGAMVLKYDRDGQLVWVAETGARGIPGEIKVDASGNIIVASMDGYGAHLTKLSASGQVLWRRPVHTMTFDHIALDPLGSIYATGRSSGAGFVVTRFDAEGRERWTSRFSENDSYASPAAGITAHQAGVSIGFALYSLTDFTNRFVAAHYDAAGVEVWRARYHDAGGDVRGMVGDASGGVYLTGMRDPPASADFQTLKFEVTFDALHPTMLSPPQHLDTIAGTNSATFSVQAGNGPNWFQWRFDGHVIPDATNSILALTNISEPQRGSYSVIVSNAYGYIISPEARLNVYLAPDVYWDSYTATNQIAIAGNELVLRAYTSGDGPMEFEWRKDGAVLAETDAFLVIERVTASDAGSYTVAVRSPYGAATNTPISVAVVPRTGIDEWRWGRPKPQGNTLLAVAFGNGRFVAVGYAGTVLTSTSGVAWTVTNLNNLDLSGVAFGNGVFTAVSSLGAIYTSADGLSWTQRHPSRTELNGHAGVSFLNGRFVIYGQRVLSSSDGVGWVDHGPAPITGRGIAAGNGKYIMPAYGYNMISTNLSDWSMHILGDGFYELVSAAYGNGVFVFNNLGELFTSADGVEVMSRHPVPYTVNIAFLNGRFFAVGATIDTSEDGVSWTRVAAGFSNALWSIAYGNGVYVAVGYGGVMASSSDGQTWTRLVDRGLINLRAMTFGNGRYVAMGEDAAWTSTDGETWTRITSAVAEQPNAITWANGTFVVVGDRGELLASRDGTSWIRIHVTDKDLRAVIHDGTRFVAVGEEIALLSTNGMEWAMASSTALNSARSIAFAEGVYVVGGGFPCFVSTNAVDWEMGFIGRADSFAYGNGIFVGVGEGRAIVSPDGLTGSSYTISDEHWFGSVTFGAGMFVACGANDAIIATSTNGENWVVHRTHTQVFGRPATYANGAFWTVGEDEGIIRSAQMEPLIHARKTGTGVELTVRAHPGKTYRLQRGTALGAWSDFQTFTPQSETTTLIDNSASSSGAFYRIVSP